jgi:proteasome lid subunit RPN8/RPN11
MKRLEFQTGQWDAMCAHVARSSPEEACGLLAGTGEIVKGIFPVTNRLHSLSRFEMDPKEQLAIFNLIEGSQLELAGIYHSHPRGPALPSNIDIGSFSYPGVAYLIWSYAEDIWTVQGFNIIEGSYSPILLDFPNKSNPNTSPGL